MGITMQEHWSRLPFPTPGDLSNPGIEPGCPTLQADFLPTELSACNAGEPDSIPGWGRSPGGLVTKSPPYFTAEETRKEQAL